MTKYYIYAGLGGSFGGAKYLYAEYFLTREEAEDVAYCEAIKEYQTHEGLHGLRSYDDIVKEYCEKNNCCTEPNYEVITDTYREEIESWIDYYVKEESEVET